MYKDYHGSRGLSINNINNKRIYKKRIKHYLKKFLLEYAKALSKELDIPMIDYSFISEDNNYYFISQCYDDRVSDHEVIMYPFECDNLLDEINNMKHFCLKFSNGMEVYNKFLKQILFSYLIGDFDRTVDNMKLYKKGNILHIAPYLDIDQMFSGDGDEEIFMDYFYLYPEDMKQEIERINNDSDGSFYVSVESINQDFKLLLTRGEDYIFDECIYDAETTGYSLEWKQILNLIYQELDDKSIFEKISDMDYIDLDKKYKLNFSENANIIISTLYEKRKNKIEQIKNNLYSKK